MITVYTQPNCGPCKQAIAALDVHGVQFEVIDVTEDAESLEHIKSLGATGTPFFMNDRGDTFQGYEGESRVKLLDMIFEDDGYWLH